MTAIGIVVTLFALAAVGIAATMRKLGRPTRTDEQLRNAKVLMILRNGDPHAAWSEKGSATQSEGLNLRFDADDDPAARAFILLPDAPLVNRASTLANVQKIRLADDFVTHHCASGKHACLVKLRGTGAVVGRCVKLQMVIDKAGNAVGVCIENDDDDDPAMGDWIEIDSIAILEFPA